MAWNLVENYGQIKNNVGPEALSLNVFLENDADAFH